MKNFCILFLSACFIFGAQAQFTLSGTYDTYAALSKKGISSLPFMVSHAKIGTYDINLLEIELAYTQNHFKLQFSPAIGSYMQNNYATETPYRRFIYESYLQYKKGKTELACGTFSSPYTQETPRGVDQLNATRSLAAEYVPYYVSGLRWTQQWKPNFKSQFFITNGWQRLVFSGQRPSLAQSVEPFNSFSAMSARMAGVSCTTVVLHRAWATRYRYSVVFESGSTHLGT